MIYKFKCNHHSLSRMPIKIGLFGGSFSPIGKHHTDIMKNIIQQNILDEIWVMPCYYSSRKRLEKAEHRLKMCEIAIKNLQEPKIKLFDYEIKTRFEGESYHFIKRFFQDYNSSTYDYYFILGSDNAQGIFKWYKADKLINMIKYIVIPRTDYDLDSDAWCLKQPHIYLRDLSLSDKSSTLIRSQLKTHHCDLIDSDVLAYILENRLYST